MKLTFSSRGICRTPIFSIEKELYEVWDELKNYIHESSPAFFQVIKDMEYKALAHSEPKIRFTIWKYFNRAKFRATPYGNFAAFSVVPVSRENQPEQLTLFKNPVEHRFTNWQEKEQINFDPEWLNKHALKLKSNTTAYRCGDELRYVNVADGAFELSAIPLEETAIAVFDFCHTQRNINEVREFLQQQHGLSKAITNDFLTQLIDLQLLITDFTPNITGLDYFSRIGYPRTEETGDYIIAERKRSAGYLQENKLQVLAELINFLRKHTPAHQDSSLTQFRESFTKRFETKEIPLLIAMDPEMGIGYKSLAQDKEEDQLIEELKAVRQQKQTTKNLSYTSLHQFILNQMIQQQTVQLHEFKEPGNEAVPAVANTISILLQCTDEHLILDQISGCTANSLLGRFSFGNEEVTKICRHFVQTEQQANPEVLFFDVAYQLEKQADNVNRRNAVYDYELPILSWTESKQVIDLDDIVLSVNGEELILHSVKYGKRIVPKMASAYNYSRSDLAVYRFLSDLQHQNLHSALSINITQIFPGLSHYQRIQYKNVILSKEKWLVPQAVCSANNSKTALIALKNWLESISLKKPFKCGVADQTLIFNPEIQEDLDAFVLFCRHKTALYIEETFIAGGSMMVKDEYNHLYLPEFLINLEHQQQIYQPYYEKTPVTHSPHTPTVFLPGEEWIYAEIYCHPSRSSSILLHLAGDFVSSFKKKMKTWFFIRYNDPANHIRLRIQLKDLADGYSLLTALTELLKPYLETGLVADVQLKTYRRETERYRNEITLIEKCFELNSEFIISILSKNLTTHELYMLSIKMMEEVWEGAEFTLKEQLQFAEHMAGLFTAEMNIGPEGFKKINQGLKDFNNSPEFSLNKKQQNKAMKTVNCFLKALSVSPVTEKHTLLADLFHMHTNRLFNNDQRMHEMIMYYYLTKRLKMKIGRLNHQN